MFKEFIVKKHYQTKHAKACDKLTESELAEKVKQLRADLASQQRLSDTQAWESNESVTKAN